MSKALIQTHVVDVRLEEKNVAGKNLLWRQASAEHTHLRISEFSDEGSTALVVPAKSGREQTKEISTEERAAEVYWVSVACGVAPLLGNDNKIAANVNEQWSFYATKN